jgi:hypothetical protein
MKLAGFLALALAAVLGIWAGVDYAHNERDRQYNLQLMEAEISRELAGGTSSGRALEHDKEIDAAERYDAIMGIVAVCALIGSIVLFSKKKTVRELDLD